MPGSLNADIGGGHAEFGTDFLRDQAVTNIVWDPFNRTNEHNAESVESIHSGGADTVSYTHLTLPTIYSV